MSSFFDKCNKKKKCSKSCKCGKKTIIAINNNTNSAVNNATVSINNNTNSAVNNATVSINSNTNSQFNSLITGPKGTNAIYDIVKHIDDDSQCDYQIHESDINSAVARIGDNGMIINANNGGVVITRPGNYCLVDDVVFNPLQSVNSTAVSFVGGGGTGATGFATISGGIVRSIAFTDRGTGYTSAPTVTINAPPSGGTQATAIASFGAVTAILMSNIGDGYLTAPTVTISGGGGTGATAVANLVNSQVVSITITNGGSGYTSNPTVTIGVAPIGGINASAGAQINPGLSIAITNGGSGYVDTVIAAITIISLNVKLMLNGHRLTQFGIDSQGNVNSLTQRPYVIGILVPDVIPTNTNPNAIGLESIYIDGNQGIINGFSMFGVRVFGHTYDIQLSNFTVKNNGKLASLASRTSNPLLANYYFPHTVANNNYGPGMGVGGLFLGESAIWGAGPVFFTETILQLQNRLHNLSITNVNSLDNYFCSINISNANDVSINASHFNDTFSDDPGRSTLPMYDTIPAWGAQWLGNDTPFEDPNIVNITVRNCTFNDTNLKGDFTTAVVASYVPVIGAFPTCGCVNVKNYNQIIENSTFDNTIQTFRGGVTASILNGSLKSANFLNCSFNGVQSIAVVNSFHLSGAAFFGFPTKSNENCSLINCTANNNVQIGDRILPTPPINNNGGAGLSVAYQISFAKNLLLENCVAENNICNGLVGAGNVAAVGYRFNPGNFAGTSGIPEFEAQNITFRGCIASRCLATNGGYVSGFFMRDVVASQDFKNINYEDCLSQGNMTIIPTLLTSNPTLQQDVAIGFQLWDIPAPNTTYPVIYNNCKAYNNVGVPIELSTNPANNPLNNLYSAGFYHAGGSSTALSSNCMFYNCESLNNIYGFFLKQCTQYVIRDCRADNNGLIGGLVINLTNGGTGYTSAPVVTIGAPPAGGKQASAVAIVTAGVVSSLIVINPGSGYTSAPIISFSGGGGTGVTATAVVTIIGEGFTDIGPVTSLAGDPSNPLISTSLFERNHAFNNGTGLTHVGTNGNYNVQYLFGPIPTLQGSLSTGYPSSVAYRPVDNISMIK